MAKGHVIESLVSDVEQLMKLHDNALAEVATLRAKNEEQSAKIRTLQTQLKEVRNELKEQSLRNAIGGATANKAAAKAQINALLREVEACIAMVSKRI
ncbi:MAG: hypothetical protein E7147_06775 [Rikenellaceae bacterium]|nr:hypothetical protein [Rikenellaceae bacterium]